MAGYLKKRYLKADLGGTINIFTYDCRVQLTYVMTFNHPDEHNFHFHLHVLNRCRGFNLQDTICCKVMKYASSARKS